MHKKIIIFIFIIILLIILPLKPNRQNINIPCEMTGKEIIEEIDFQSN